MDYKEKLRLAKEAWDSGSYDRETIEYLFPELKESEDEKIRKIITLCLEECVHSDIIRDYEKDDAIAWLEKQSKLIMELQKTYAEIGRLVKENYYLKEKQGEQKPAFEMKTPEESLGIDSDTYNKIVDECIYGDDKPTWSEEDEEMLTSTIFSLAEFVGNGDKIDWLKSLKDRVHPKQEWSEEDEKHLEGCLQYFGTITKNSIFYKDYLWLKSLRPQKQWKPSERQLECLGYAIEKAEKDWSPLTNNRIYLTLKALKEQLEKLQ